MGRRKRKQLRRKMKRANMKPIEKCLMDTIQLSSKKVHRHTINRLHRAERHAFVCCLLTETINFGDIKAPLLMFVGER